MQSFTGFLTEDYLSEATIPDNIKDVLSGLKYEIDNKKSSSGRTIIIVRDNDRIDTRDDFFKSLKDAGISAEIKDYASSSIEHIWLKDKFEDSEDNKNIKVMDGCDYCYTIYFDEGDIKKNCVYKRMDVINKILFVPICSSIKGGIVL